MRFPLFMAAVMVAAGCGRSDESTSQKAGRAVGESVSGFALGVGKGVDKQMEVKVELSAPLTAMGLTYTVAKLSEPGRHSMTLYLIANKRVTGTLLAKAVNQGGAEIGRSTAAVELAADDAAYITFKFDERTDMAMVEKYTVELKAE